MKALVVIPVYNTPKKYLQECIKGLFWQGPDSAVPWMNTLIIDDGSTAIDTLEFLAEQDKAEILTKSENTGLSDTMNLALTVTKERGYEWIIKLDSDDIPNANMYRALTDAVQRMPDSAVIACQLEAFGKRNFKSNHPALVTPQYAVGAKHFWFTNHTGVIMNVDALIKAGGYPDYRKGFSEDVELWVNVLLSGGKIRNLNSSLLKYRVNDIGMNANNKTNPENIKFLERTIRKLKWIF